ncbi:hypothetical protein [Janthinobacterium sp. J1-1]|uniref:hypothetical protein n=1 Tax=Janthinobacterium sp. J1-1 TaxID=3065910 RepID=UPI0028122141|nr:hypothetical protein [Janthinobacterium sp. J1-1]
MEQQPAKAYLIDVVEVDKSKRIRCQAESCGHAVYARIHVVLDSGKFVVLGGSCFQRLYGMALQNAESHYGGSASYPTQLTEEMRALLTSNTVEFVELLEQRRQQLEAEAAKREEWLTLQASQRKAEVEAQSHGNNWVSERLAVLANDSDDTFDQYRYMWSSSWWASPEKLFADVRDVMVNPIHAAALHKAIVALVRQPSISPVSFAVQLENDGVPCSVTLRCLRAIRLVVRAKAVV